MDARRLLITPIVAAAIAAATVFSVNVPIASAEVPAPQVSPYLRAAIKAEAEARGYAYAGDFKFDAMYARPGDWVSSVQSVGPDGAVVTFGKFASDEIVTARFVRSGEYGWVNPESGVGSPQAVPILSAQPGTQPDSWVIEGLNFPANQEVTFFDGSALGGEQRAPTDHVLGKAIAGADGAFKVVLQLEPSAKPMPGQVHRLIQASGGAFIQVAFHHAGSTNGQTPPPPTQVPPTKAPPTPAAPTQPGAPDPTPAVPVTGDKGNDGGGSDASLYSAGALVALAALGGVGIVVVKRRQ